ncbi:MAG: hypothetical protein ACRDNC_11870 [Gaiellaceae bacterium]
MRRRKTKRRILWLALFLGLLLLAVAGLTVRAVGAIASTARRPLAKTA